MRLVGIYFSCLSTREINFPTRLISTLPWKVLNNHYSFHGRANSMCTSETITKNDILKIQFSLMEGSIG